MLDQSGPDAAREGLRRMHGAGPAEGLWQQLVDTLDLRGFVFYAIAALVVGLVPNVPAENAVVVGKGTDDSLNIGF